MKNKIKEAIAWILIASLILVLPACGGDQRPPDEVQEENESVLIYAALNPLSQKVKSSIKKFNNEHTDIQIEVHDYSDEGGIERLHTELVLGKVPDIMEMHYYGKSGVSLATDPYNTDARSWSYTPPASEYWMPYRQMAQKGYLEDLWPYIENDPKLGLDGLQQTITKSAEVDGGLYILFEKVVIYTLSGKKSVVGDRYSWTLEELMEVFNSMPEDSTILRYNTTRWEVFNHLLQFTLDRYVNRKTGECYFDGQEFLNLVHFLEKFPEEAESEDLALTEETIITNIKYGRQLLESSMICWPMEIVTTDALWGDYAAFPGFPTADGSSGSYFYPQNTVLAMSSTCRNKDAAWEYIRELVMPRRTKGNPTDKDMRIPVNQHDYEMLLYGDVRQVEQKLKNFTPEETMQLFSMAKLFHTIPIVQHWHLLTEADAERHRELVNHTTRLYWPDDELANIVWETLAPYFAGDQSLDDAIRMTDNRVSLYLKEQM